MNAQTVQDRNRDLAKTINEEAMRDPNSQYAGKFLGIIDGRVEVVADSLNELGTALRNMAADREATLCMQAGVDHSKAQFIWDVK